MFRVQNRRFASSSVQTGTHASVGRIGGGQYVETTDRQATGASNEGSVARETNHLQGGLSRAMDRKEGLRPLRMMRTLSSGSR